MSLLYRQIPALAIIGVVLAVTVLIKDSFLWLDTSAIIAIYALLALSAGASYGLAGILTVAQASFASIGAYATAIATIRYGVSPYLSIVLSVALPVLIAYPVARAVNRLSPLALAIATLFFGQIVDLAIRNGGDFTGNYIGLSGIPTLPGLSSPLAFHLACWAIVCVVVFLYSNLVDSAWGRAMATLRYDSLRATADGVDVPRMRSIAFALAAAMAGLSGWLYAHHGAYLSPDSLGTSQSLSALLMAVIGGAQYALGPVVGAAVLTLVLGQLPGQELLGMFYGTVLILVLVVMPRGLLGAFAAIVNRFTSQKRQVRAAAPNEASRPASAGTAPTIGDAALTCTGLRVRYGPIAVCHDITLSIARGEKVLLLGPNGAGKSSLLGAIAGVVSSSGQITVDGKDIQRHSPNRRSQDGVAFVPEIRGNLFPTLSVEENLRSALRLMPSSKQAAAYQKMTGLFPILSERASTQTRMLSGGEQQMLAVAMAAARSPTVLLLDEPSQGLAPSIYGVLREAFEQLTRDGIALLIAEQNIPFASSIASRCLVLKGGRLVAAEGPELLANPERIAALFLQEDRKPATTPDQSSNASGLIQSAAIG
jgi:branched-chain amino acid transport system permease protein